MQAVIGSRSIKNFDFSNLPLTDVVSGGAIGVDTLIKNHCVKNNIPILEILPNYSKFGKSAPLIRNKEIVDKCNILYAIYDGVSKGTLYTINLAKKAGKKVIIINV